MHDTAEIIKAWADILKAVAWPIAILAMVWIMRVPLRALIGEIESFTFEHGSTKGALRRANRSTAEGFFPLADANPYGDLLGAKYARAINKLEPTKNKIQVTDLSFAIFDELIPSERLENLSFGDVIRYRKGSEKARETFLEHLAVLQAKQAAIGPEGNYAGAIDKLVTTEILPAARNFKNQLQKIGDTLFGALAKGALGYLGSSATLSLFTDLSWQNLLRLAGLFGAYVGKSAIDHIVADRAARRECSISYILSLDK